MSVTKKIKLLLVERELTMSDLARKLNTGKANMSGKMKRDNFSERDIKDIAEALDCEYEILFTMRDTGKQI